MLSPFQFSNKNPMRGLGLSAVMKKRQKQVAKEQSGTGRAIPTDLLISIFSRVPAKSVARFRCLSKQWYSILQRPHFTELFWTESSARPRLLFAIRHNRKWLFFSSHQPLNPDLSLSTLPAYQYKTFPTYFSLEICEPVRGLICTQSRKPMICNPSTGQYVALPKAESLRTEMKTFFGYDLIKQIFKVLSVSKRRYQVLTLGLGELFWRTMECSIPHFPLLDGICIDGVLYYLAWCTDENINPYPFMVVSFNVSFETFKFLGIDKEIRHSTLINCKGKLGAIKYDFPGFIVEDARIVLRVLIDADANIWSRHIYVLPPFWRNLVAQTWLYIVGMAPTGEIVLSSPCSTLFDNFCIFYYNVERNTIAIVKIELRVEASKRQKVYTFVEHVENVKPMQLLRAS